MTVTQRLAFEIWQERLLEDCKRHHKLLPHSRLVEECLRILWDSGVEPSVRGITDEGKSGGSNGEWSK